MVSAHLAERQDLGSISLLFLSDTTPLWGLVLVSIVFGVQNGLTVVTIQAAATYEMPVR